MKKRLTVYFSGSVQGVGFRFMAQRISKRFEVLGFVRNLPNGQVQLVSEGEEDNLKDFLNSIRDSNLKSNIRQIDVEWSEFKGEFQVFGIVR